MKNVFFAAALVLATMASCTGPSSTELKQKNDSLYLALAEKDRLYNDLTNGVIEINENLSRIKEKENIVALNAAEAGNNASMKDQINQDIKMIYDLMVQNQEKIAQLEKQLRGANRENANMKKLIESLNQQLKEKTEEIARLTQELMNKNIQIDELNSLLGSLKISMDSLRHEHTTTTEKLSETTIELNKAYYVIGTSKELKEKNIINPEGFLNLKKKVLNEDFDSSYFTEIDIRTTNEISVNKKKAKVKVLTSHPESSYKLQTNSDGTVTVVISDQKQFWSVSKFLVLQVS
ncbi:MAG: hypothetical protein QM786_04045 [Breznakibacter sp.]